MNKLLEKRASDLGRAALKVAAEATLESETTLPASYLEQYLEPFRDLILCSDIGVESG
ncbi:hypothetical protein [Ruegeria halocynthiae]|uniref:hypothetical protein n=1 Tax=Ruegeria halocynthiae TaxID=985054 RepID=UPI000B20C116|nr:hypothetical protein [Ruegeria halocynthiae]